MMSSDYRKCAHCDRHIAEDKQATARYCSRRCQTRAAAKVRLPPTAPARNHGVSLSASEQRFDSGWQWK